MKFLPPTLFICLASFYFAFLAFLLAWRKLHNEELHNFCSAPSLIRMIKSRRMTLAGHVARIGEKSNEYWWES
jgi:hypothetical protein